MSAPSLFHRLRERKLFQWAVAYLAAAWALVEATSLVGDQFHWPIVVGQIVTVAALFGFFVTLVLAWYHGEKGYQRVRSSELLIITVILAVAGAAVSNVRRNAAAAAVEPDGLSAMARFAASTSDRPTIAVLPLTNLSADPENAYFAAGIHEELLRRLSLVRALAVISRTSVLQYANVTKAVRDIAAEIGARYVVEGSVQEDQGRVRIQVQLIDATTDAHVWAERYDRTMDDVFELQSEVAQAIAGALETAVTPDERERIQARPTHDPIAWDLYLRAGALSHYKKGEYDTAIELLRRATRLDPNFSLAHARLATIYWNGRALHGYPPLDSAHARAAIAVEVGPDVAKARSFLAFILASFEQYDLARGEAERALALDPSNELAWGALSASGWWSGDPVGGALAGRQGVRLDPRGFTAAFHLAVNLFYAGMADEAERWLEHVLEDRPEDMWAWQALMSFAWCSGDLAAARRYASRMLTAGAGNLMAVATAAYLTQLEGNLEAARAELRQVASVAPDLALAGSPTAQASLAWVEARLSVAGARSRLDTLRDRRMQQVAKGSRSVTLHSDLVVIASALGDADEELRWFLEVSRVDRTGLWRVYIDAPFLDPIRDRPEFQAVLRETEARLTSRRRELAAMGEWTPEAVLTNTSG